MEQEALVIGIFIGLGAIFVTIILGLFAIGWQNRQLIEGQRSENQQLIESHRAENRQLLEAQRAENRELLEAQRAENQQREYALREEAREREYALREENRQRDEALAALMESIRTKVSDTELEQARLEGVNSVLRQHLHTHEGDDD